MCLCIRTPFPLPYVCVCVCFSKKEWVIVPHCLRECVVCSMTCPTLLKSYHGFWVELWCAFVLKPLSLSLISVCVCLFLKIYKYIYLYFFFLWHFYFYFIISFIVLIETSILAETPKNCQYDLIFYLMINFRGIVTYLMVNTIYIASIAGTGPILTYLVLSSLLSLIWDYN